MHKRDKYQTRAKTNISAQMKRLYIEKEQITALSKSNSQKYIYHNLKKKIFEVKAKPDCDLAKVTGA